jgi:alpha-mannosidase
MRKTICLAICFFPVLMMAQPALPAKFFKGYERSVKGGGFGYHSPQPDVTSSLLLRSIDSVQYIAWETETIPASCTEQKVNLVWMFGIDANTDSHTFNIYLNGRYCLSFTNPVISDSKPWLVDGGNGCTLLFRPVMIDKYGDPMGYAVFTAPVSLVLKGKPQQIRMSGESKESRTWYMTFEAGVEENLVISQVPALVRGDGQNFIPVLFQFVHLGEPVKGSLEITGGPKAEFTLETGFNEIKVLMPEDTPTGEHHASINILGEKQFIQNFTISVPRYFTIYLVQHTHTDIGYTRPQTEILPDHLRYIDYALDYCDQTDSLPDDARFRWTCETSWAVREYLETRPASQVERLKRRVKEGRIEITGLFLNSSDLADETMIAATLQPIKEFRDQGFPVRTAMQSDINGVPWCLTDYLSGAGVGYLNMAQNTHRADKPFDTPTTFWWESPSGNRIMVNRPEHYMWGNSLGILAGGETFGKGLFQHLQDITGKGYPYAHYGVQFSGYLTDNSPPSTTACRLVDEWNKTYAWPKLRLATISEFMDYMKKDHSTDLPVIRGAWPDWWMDGFGSAAIQTAYARKAHAGYIANEGLMSMAAIMGARSNNNINGLQGQITDDIAFYDEHTFGAAESITDPLCENSVVQLGEKESYVWSAVKKNHMLREEVMGQVQPFIPKSDVPTIAIFNTLNWTRSGNAMVYVDHQLIPRDMQFRVLDADGRSMAIQPVSTREEGTWWMLHVKDVPPLGFRSYRIVVDQEPRVVPGETTFGGVFENEFYRVNFDLKNNKISGFFDKKLKKELVDSDATYTMGELIYERLGKNRGQLEQHKLDEFTRVTWNDLRVSSISHGPVWQSIVTSGKMAGCADPSGIRCEIRLYNHEKKVEFCYSMKKLPVTDPEGVYVAFPFRLNNSHHVVEVAGGTMVPGRDQVEGSASDWQGIQNFVSLRSDSGQIVFVSPEIPLVQLGAINLGKFSRISNPESGKIFSWVLNNYWTTNFLASQEGELKWTYQISSLPDPSNALATRFGMENRIPFLNRVFPASANPDSLLIPRSFFASNKSNPVLVSARPAASGKGIVMQLRETSGRADSIPIDDLVLSSITLARAANAVSATEVNVLEEPVRRIWARDAKTTSPKRGSWMAFRPWETKFLLLALPE